jgi:hypothetical protein
MANTPTTWEAGTRVTLARVPWDTGYKRVVDWKNSNRDGFFEYLPDTLSIENVMYLRHGQPVIVSLPYSKVIDYNYMVAKNPQDGTSFYYFIKDSTWMSPNSTALDIQLDVWTTYIEDIEEWGECFVERSHIHGVTYPAEPGQQYNIDTMIEPEGFDLGDNYDTAATYFIPVLNDNPKILITSATKMTGDWGDEENAIQVMPEGSFIDGFPVGVGAYVINGEDWEKFSGVLSTHPWIAGGIQSITLIPGQFIRTAIAGEQMGIIVERVIETHFEERRVNLPGIREVVDSGGFTKLYTHPFTVIECDNNMGGVTHYKPQYMEYSIDKPLSFYISGVLNPPQFAMALLPPAYNSKEKDPIENKRHWVDLQGFKKEAVNPRGDELQKANWIQGLPQFATITNGHIMAMAATAHTRQTELRGIDWSYDLATRGANDARSMAGMAMSSDMQRMSVTATQNAQNYQTQVDQMNRSTLLNAVASPLAGVAGGAMMGANPASIAVGAVGGVGAAAMGAVSNEINKAALQAQHNTSMQALAGMTNISAEQASFNRDANYDYAQFANSGNKAQAIAGVMARVQDSEITPNAIVGMDNGVMFNAVNGLYGWTIKIKTVKPHIRRKIIAYWEKYGYTRNCWHLITDLVGTEPIIERKMDYTYWKTTETNILKAKCPQFAVDTIRGIMEQGVTVWADPYAVGRY